MSATTKSLADYRLAAEALAMLLAARLALLCLRFPVAMALLGLRLGPDGGAVRHQGADPVVAAVRLAVRRAAGRAPFRAVCLQQAVAAALMLRRRGRPVEVHFGVARGKDRALSAHAWSICAGLVVTGEAAIEGHVPIAVFVT